MRVHPFADEFPMMSGTDWAEFVESVQRDGLVHPIELTHDGEMLVDGRNRLQACRDLGIEPTFVRLPEMTEEQLLNRIISANLSRRHLDTGQRALLAVAALPHYAAAARERQVASTVTAGKASGAARRGERPAVSGGAFETGEAVAQAAKAFGVGKTSVREAKALATEAPDLAAEVKAGTKRLGTAVREAKARKVRGPNVSDEWDREAAERYIWRVVYGITGALEQLSTAPHQPGVKGHSVEMEPVFAEAMAKVDEVVAFVRTHLAACVRDRV
jgi:ParB-like chromosome segregation protein Spo0J